MTTTRVAIVTGASSGIGEATARRLRGMGYTVYAAARRIEQMAPLAEVGIRPVRVDVTDDASLTSFVAQVIADAVARAVRARRPRTRYAVGMGAKPLIFARRVLSDRSFDRVMRLVFRLDDHTAGAPNPHCVPA